MKIVGGPLCDGSCVCSCVVESEQQIILIAVYFFNVWGEGERVNVVTTTPPQCHPPSHEIFNLSFICFFLLGFRIPLIDQTNCHTKLFSCCCSCSSSSAFQCSASDESRQNLLLLLPIVYTFLPVNGDMILLLIFFSAAAAGVAEPTPALPPTLCPFCGCRRCLCVHVRVLWVVL